jgi:cobalamin biosynthesis protein CobD/CbiB
MDAWTHYNFDYRITLLLLAHCAALILGGPRWLHPIILYDAPARGVRAFLSALEVKLNRPERSSQVRKLRGRMVLWFGISVSAVCGLCLMYLSAVTQWGWAIEMLLLAYIMPIRAAHAPVTALKEAIAQKNLQAVYAIASGLPTCTTSPKDVYGALRAAMMYSAELIPRYVIIPALFYLLAGLAGALIYRLLTLWIDRFTHSHQLSYSASALLWSRMLSAIPYQLAAIVQWLALAFVPKASAPRAASAFAVNNKGALGCKLSAYGLHLTLGGAGLKDSYGHYGMWIGYKDAGKARVSVNDLSRALVWNGYTIALWMLIIMVIAAIRLQ